MTKPPQLKSRGRTNRDMNRRTNPEGQPRLQTSQLTDAVDTAGQKRTHPKVRESKQGYYTVAHQWELPDTGCRTQRTPASQPAQEKHRKYKGRVAAQPTPPAQQVRHPVTEKAENPQGQPAAGQAAQTAGPGGRARHKVENQAAHQRHRQPNNKAPPQEQDRQLEPERLWNPLRVTSGRTCRGKLQEEAQKQHQKRLNNSLPHAEQEERKKTQLRRLRKNPTHTQGPPEMGARS